MQKSTSHQKSTTGLSVSEDKIEESKKNFIEQYPQFLQTTMLDDLRKTEYERIDRQGHIYLDYTGGGLYSEKQVETHMTLLLENVFGNPHSTNPTSQVMTQLVESARRQVLKFFNASPVFSGCPHHHTTSPAVPKTQCGACVDTFGQAAEGYPI